MYFLFKSKNGCVVGSAAGCLARLADLLRLVWLLGLLASFRLVAPLALLGLCEECEVPLIDDDPATDILVGLPGVL